MAELLAAAGIQPYTDRWGIGHKVLLRHTIGVHRCDGCREMWPCRTVLLATVADDHPAKGWCDTCRDVAPCRVWTSLLASAVTP